MPTKAGLSHGFAAFSSLLLGNVLSKYVWEMTPSFSQTATITGEYLSAVTGVTYEAQFVGAVFLSFLIAFLWGVGYHFSS